MLRQMGFTCAEADDPYVAMAELCRNPSEYKALVLSLAGVYAEELELIATIKRRHPEVEVWLTDADGRQSALGEAIRLGADGLADEDGLHRVAMTPPEGRTRGATAATVLAAELAQLTAAEATADACGSGAGENVCGAAKACGDNAPVENGAVENAAGSDGNDMAQAESAQASRGTVGEPQATSGGRASIDREPEADDPGAGDPVLTADELRALLHEPAAPTQASHSEP
jgi:hypothetical protein